MGSPRRKGRPFPLSARDSNINVDEGLVNPKPSFLEGNSSSFRLLGSIDPVVRSLHKWVRTQKRPRPAPFLSILDLYSTWCSKRLFIKWCRTFTQPWASQISRGERELVSVSDGRTRGRTKASTCLPLCVPVFYSQGRKSVLRFVLSPRPRWSVVLMRLTRMMMTKCCRNSQDLLFCDLVCQLASSAGYIHI